VHRYKIHGFFYWARTGIVCLGKNAYFRISDIVREVWAKCDRGRQNVTGGGSAGGDGGGGNSAAGIFFIENNFGVKYHLCYDFDFLVSTLSLLYHAKAHPVSTKFLGFSINHKRSLKTLSLSYPGLATFLPSLPAFAPTVSALPLPLPSTPPLPMVPGPPSHPLGLTFLPQPHP
jgi:hypothetical protein